MMTAKMSGKRESSASAPTCPRVPQSRRSLVLLMVLFLFAPAAVLAGPLYVTDDPEPVEYRHWEVYLASQLSHDVDSWSGTAPHIEVNYGAFPNFQPHVIAPLPSCGQHVGVHSTAMLTRNSGGSGDSSRRPSGTHRWARSLSSSYQLAIVSEAWEAGTHMCSSRCGSRRASAHGRPMGGRILGQSGRGEPELVVHWLASAVPAPHKRNPRRGECPAGQPAASI